MTIERILLLIAVVTAASGWLLSSWTLLWIAAITSAVFVVTWILFELRPKDPWRKYRKHRPGDP